MKKIYATLFCVLSVRVLLAQPVITSNWAPSGNFGSNITVTSNTGTHSPGASGANCTWNLTSWSSATSFNSLDTCSFNISTVDYPGTTDLITETQTTGIYYRFHKLAGSVYQDLGYDIHYNPGGDYDHYVLSTPIDLLHFPVNYNNQFITNGHYSRQWTYGSSYYASHGGVMVLVSVDGYGQLNTPAGGFVNVLRIHSQENYTDSVDIAFQTWNITSSSTDRYDWISADRPGIILASTSTTTSVNGTTHYSYYSQVAPTLNAGIDNLTATRVNLTIYPQPATGQTTVYITCPAACQATLILTDMQGRAFVQKTVSLLAGKNAIPLNVQDFSNGLYVLAIRCKETLITQRFIVSNP